MLVSISVNACRCCGCKSSTFIYICKAFFYIISIFFINRWFCVFYNPKFFSFFSGFGLFCLFYGFCRKDAKARNLWFLLFWLVKKALNWKALVFLLFSQVTKALSFLFLTGILFFSSKLLLKTHVLAPIVVEILLLFSLKSKRLKRIAGNSSQ